MQDRFDVVVIGGGHAGIEAAHAAARLGRETALLSMDSGAIGRMSCNPAIGGVAKGQLVRDLDALGGLMGVAADVAGIQFRMLNLSKGPAVWGPRAQMDMELYAETMQGLLRRTPRLVLLDGELELLPEDLRIEQVLHADPDARRLVRVRRPDPAPRRSDLQAAEAPLARPVERDVPRHDEVRVAGDEHEARRLVAA